ncbi:hypothetical protein FRB90_011618 [Tulasnella sp. 427]|nr:hypothetical protein FRB90_011618 [Tulasnella sp. 427]
MFLDELPPELILRILTYTPLQGIRSFDLTSNFCHSIVISNESVIYLAAAVLHGFTRPPLNQQALSALLAELISQPDALGWLDDVTNWKEFCKRNLLREYAWRGLQPKDKESQQISLRIINPHGRTLRAVHRFKVDEMERTVICSGERGGLAVASIDGGEILWQLSLAYVLPYAHVEFDQGFLTFTRRGGIEIWRRSSDCFDPNTYLPCNPAPAQLTASPYPAPRFPPTFPPIYDDDSTTRARRTSFPSLPQRGVYLPFAIAMAPVSTQASRFVYPDLLTASTFGWKAFIWNVPTSKLIETVDITPPSSQNLAVGVVEAINYVELNRDYVFVCWSSGLMVYHRQGQIRHQNSPSNNLYFPIYMGSLRERDPGRSLICGAPCPIYTVELPIYQKPAGVALKYSWSDHGMKCKSSLGSSTGIPPSGMSSQQFTSLQMAPT